MLSRIADGSLLARISFQSHGTSWAVLSDTVLDAGAAFL
jgi:hypothetical protein